jgi:hypothetical protein
MMQKYGGGGGMSTTASSVIEFKQDDFTLDFNSAVNSSDKSTTDNFLSDDGDHKLKTKKRAAGGHK